MDPTALRSAAGWLAVAVGLAAAAGWSGLTIRFAQGVRGAPSLSATGARAGRRDTRSQLSLSTG